MTIQTSQNPQTKKNKWSIMARTLNTTFVMELKLKLLEFDHSAEINAKCHLTNILLNYGLILGRDIQHELGIIIVYKIKLSIARSFILYKTKKL